MCRRTLRWTLVAAVVAAGTPAAVTAQQTMQAQEQVLERHLDSITPLLAQAESAVAVLSARRVDEQKAKSAPVTDTLAIGPLRVVTIPSQQAIAERMFRDVWDRAYAPFVSHSPALEKMTFTFEWATPLVPIYVDGDVRRVESGRWRPESALIEGIRQAISTTIFGDLADTQVGAWVAGPVGPSPYGALIYRTMAGAPWKIDQACVGGDGNACWKALGLGLSAMPETDWYTPEERRALVASLPLIGVRSYKEGKALQHSCVADAVFASCDSLLGVRPEHGYVSATRSWSPLPVPSARAQLLWLALEAGGSGAWARLREHPDMSAEKALEYASGLTQDQLGERWQRWLVSQRPPTRAALDPSLLFTLVWVVALAALAMRNTRWRLG